MSLLCDWQMFWHEHYERPALIQNVVLGVGYTEHLMDDGTIEERPYNTMVQLMEAVWLATETVNRDAEDFWFRAMRQGEVEAARKGFAFPLRKL